MRAMSPFRWPWKSPPITVTSEVKFVAGVAIVIAGGMAVWATWRSVMIAKGEGRGHWAVREFVSPRVLISVLMVELAVFLMAGIGYRPVADDIHDYYAFAFPCAAAMTAGLGLLAPRDDGMSPWVDLNVRWLFVAAALLAVGWAFYLARHPSHLVNQVAFDAAFAALVGLTMVELLRKPRKMLALDTLTMLLAIGAASFALLGLLSNLLR